MGYRSGQIPLFIDTYLRSHKTRHPDILKAGTLEKIMDGKIAHRKLEETETGAIPYGNLTADAIEKGESEIDRSDIMTKAVRWGALHIHRAWNVTLTESDRIYRSANTTSKPSSCQALLKPP